MILDNSEIVLVWSFLILYSISVSLALKRVNQQATQREKPLFFLLLLNLITLFLASLVAFFVFDSWKPDIRDLASLYVFLVVGAFVITLEAPGFIILSSYDNKTIEVLSDVRKNLVSLAYNFDSSVQNLLSLQKANETRLSEQHISEILDYFVKSCARIKNIDASLLNLILSETNLSIREVSQQSKHPFPRLVDILSLTGLSFLIAQLLK
jgi:hypothetical protein